MTNLKNPQQSMTARIMVSDGKRREEMPIPDQRAYQEWGKTQVDIINPQRGAMWKLFPEKHKYLERTGKIPAASPPLPGDPNHPCGHVKELTCTKLGADTIEGRPTEKWEITATHEGKTMRQILWIDRNLGAPIAGEVPGQSRWELKNIRVGPQPEGAFELPAGYQKVEVPQQQSGQRPQGGQMPPGQMRR